ncbi:MAG: RNA polymerase sigma factor [Candidatus Limnocylindrales bacterium]
MDTEPPNPSAADSAAGIDRDLEDAYGRYHGALVRYALVRTRDEQVAADVADEAFLRLVREWAAGRRPDEVLPWLRRVALNDIVSRARRRAVADRWEPWLRPTTVTTESPELMALAGERNGLIREAMAGLEPAERTALVLAAHGFEGREIAARIGRTEGATRTLLCRARARLRVELREVATA